MTHKMLEIGDESPKTKFKNSKSHIQIKMWYKIWIPRNFSPSMEFWDMCGGGMIPEMEQEKYYRNS